MVVVNKGIFMLSILIIGLFVVITSVFPVMFAANKLGAQKTELVDCIIAVIIGGLVSSFIAPLIPGANTNEAAGFIYTLIITGVVYKFLLQASYISGMLIALISTIIKSVLILLIAKIVT